jgi:hypothetical protein
MIIIYKNTSAAPRITTIGRPKEMRSKRLFGLTKLWDFALFSPGIRLFY